ncbi:MAG: glycosyltransferase [[Clostridium] leptum]
MADRTFARILIDSLLPKEVKRVLYLDCDILVLGSLKDLWEMEFKR